VGIIVRHKVGDSIKKGMPLFTVHANNEEKLNQAAELLDNACKYSESEVEKLPQFYGLIE